MSRIAAILLLFVLTFVSCGCQALQRKAIFHPTHHTAENGLTRWIQEGNVIGFGREAPAPENIWLMLHGNSGQAADRVYALAVFPPQDSVFILEYPGYGQRPGKPSRRSFDEAALAAYQDLRQRFPGKRLCVAAESIGSGPAAMLAAAQPAPDKLVFFVPFADLRDVGRDYSPHAPMGLLLAGAWNNPEALANYQGPMEVFGAQDDEVIDVRHARALAASRPQAKFHLLPGGHNGWTKQPGLCIRCP